MPKKQTKKTKKTTAKKTTRKTTTKRAASSSKKKTSKASSAKKKAPAKKKAAPKKKTSRAKKKAPARKKTELQTPSEPRSKTAPKSSHEMHARSQARQNVYENPTKTNYTPLAGFSFPKALSQVRDRVQGDTAKFSAAVPQPEKKSRLTAQRAESKPDLSPYLLDLKQKKTVIHSHRIASVSATRQSQSRLGIFEEESRDPFTTFLFKLGGLVAPLFPQKRVNLLPRADEPTLGDKFARLRRRLSYRLEVFGYTLSKPYQWFRDLQRQKTLSFPEAGGATRIQLLTSHTRSGQAIPVSQITKSLAAARQATAEAAKHSVVELSSILKKSRQPRPKFALPELSLQRAVVPFAALCLVLLLPFAGASVIDRINRTQVEVTGAANRAISQLQDATKHAQAFDFFAASKQFEEASQAFLAASAIIENQYGFTADAVAVLPVVGKKVQAGKDLLAIGNELSEAATLFSQGVAVLADENHFLADQPLSYKLEYLFVRLQEAQPHVLSASAKLKKIDPADLPEDVRPQIEVLQKNLPLITQKLVQVNEIDDTLLSFLGHQTLERYLVVFQNNTELRATGGFFGSMALVDLDRAEIEDIEIPGGGPYDYQGTLFENYAAPRALQLINPRLELHDANWFFDWPTSAQKISRLYEKAGGPTVDGVIAVNTNVLESLLGFLGPVTLEEYGKEFSQQNFRDVLQAHVEFEYDQELNQPKKIIGDLAPILLEQVKNLEPAQYLELAAYLGEHLKERDLLLYHSQPEVQSALAGFGWTGEVLQPDADYLAVVHTNLAGGKTDGVIDDVFDLVTHISENGRVQHTLTIERTHNGVKGVPLVGVRNVDYLRVYVPKGSRLISAQGFEAPPAELFETPGENWKIDEDLAASEAEYIVHDESGTEVYTESGKTVFAHWVQVDPGQKAEVKLVYEVPSGVVTEIALPEKESSWADWFMPAQPETAKTVRAYQLYWQKQSGAWDPQMQLTVNYPQEWELRPFVDAEGQAGPGSWSSQASMNADSVWSFLLY